MTETAAPSPPTPNSEPAQAAAHSPADRSHGQVRWVVAAVAVAALVALFWPKGDGRFEAPGGFLYDGTGRPQTLAKRLTPVSLVHFWATWCPPCMTEMPALNQLIDDYSDKPGFDVVMIAVQDDQGKVETFAGDRSAMMLYDPSWDVAHRYGTRKLPETYLVVDGEVIEKWEGAVDWNDPEIRARLANAVAEFGRPAG